MAKLAQKRGPHPQSSPDEEVLHLVNAVGLALQVDEPKGGDTQGPQVQRNDPVPVVAQDTSPKEIAAKEAAAEIVIGTESMRARKSRLVTRMIKKKNQAVLQR